MAARFAQGSPAASRQHEPLATAQVGNHLRFQIAEGRFAILGDDGINDKTPDGFWDSVRDIVQDHFRNGRFAEGLSEGIKKAGEELSRFFPHERGDVNELADAISYADENENKEEKGQ